MASSSAPLISCWLGNRIGLPEIRSLSLPNATTLPVIATPPIRIARNVETPVKASICGFCTYWIQATSRPHRPRSVEQSHQFRHRSHPDETRGGYADDRADEQTDPHPREVHAALDEGRRYRQQHRQGGDEVAHPRGLLPAQHADAQDEADGRDYVSKLDEGRVHSCFFFPPWNMPSIRSVTR